MKLSQVKTREVKVNEIQSGLKLRNQIFPSITLEDWERGDPKTAAIALAEKEVVGFIPLALRKISLAPDVEITAAYENAVGTKKTYRGQGIGSKMIKSAVDFIPKKADALFVIRGGERSRGYNFYYKTGHVDLHYVRLFSSDLSLKKNHSQIKITGKQDVLEQQRKMEPLFKESYSNIFGYRPRKSTYWKKALNATYFSAHPMNFHFIKLVEDGELKGYIIAASDRDESKQKVLSILEVAAQNACYNKVKLLLEAAAQFADQKRMKSLEILCGDSNPFIPVFQTLNFSSTLRGRQTMAIIPDAKSFFNKTWEKNFNLPDGIDLNIWTPARDFRLIESSKPKSKTVTLEMKDRTFTRWLLGRINLKARIEENTVTVNNANSQIINSINKAIPYHDWEYFEIDFV